MNEVLNSIHNSSYGAHLGKRKTINKFNERFYRPYSRTYIYNYLKTCDICQKIKNIGKNRAELLYLMPSRTNQLIASDFAGPLQETDSGNKYIQVICDVFGKFVVLRAHKSKEMANAVDTLVNDW